MAKKVEFIINMAGNATKGVTQLGNAVESARTKVTGLKTAFATIGSVGSQLMGVIYSVQAITSKFKEFTDASEAQNVAQTKLSKVMRNTMNASDEEYKSILKLTEQQQKLGVIGDEVQIAGAQELGTYITKIESLKKLIPVMNDMLAQQYGVNASQEQAVTIGSMIGKVMNGQVGALSRYGYKFDETQEKIIKFGTEEQKLAAVMDIVNEAVGGMNQELANSPEGKIAQMNNRLGDMKEQVGNIFNQIKIAAMPLMELGVNFLENMMPLINQVLAPIENVINYIVQLKPILTEVFNSVKGAIGGIFKDTGKWMDYLNVVVNLVREHLLPGVKRIFEIFGRVAAKVAEFHRNSEILKDIFKAIGSIVGGIMDAFVWLFDEIVWLWEHTILPVMKAIEKVYKWIKGSNGVEVKTTQTVKVDAPKKPNVTTPDKLSKGGTENSVPTEATKGAKETVTGGTRNTQITINLGKMTENVVFNGTLGEKREELMTQFKEMMLQVLYSAGNANI